MHLPRISTKSAMESHTVTVKALSSPETLRSSFPKLDTWTELSEKQCASGSSQKREARGYRILEHVIGSTCSLLAGNDGAFPRGCTTVIFMVRIFGTNSSRLSCRIIRSLFSHLSVFACSQFPFFLYFFICSSDPLFRSIILAAKDLYTLILVYPPKSTSPNVSLRLSPITLFIFMCCNKL
jgi:hypothetical protein